MRVTLPSCAFDDFSSRGNQLRYLWAIFLLFTISHLGATTVEPPVFDEMVGRSDYIVRASVRGVSSEKQIDSLGRRIVTYVKLNLLEVVAGTPPAEITLELLGGKVGDEEMRVEGMPEFKVGDEDILFVSGNGKTICPLYGMMHGRYRVKLDAVTGRRYVSTPSGLPLREIAQLTRPPSNVPRSRSALNELSTTLALAPEAFIQEIQARFKVQQEIQHAK
jgi:hypothetical protein